MELLCFGAPVLTDKRFSAMVIQICCISLNQYSYKIEKSVFFLQVFNCYVASICVREGLEAVGSGYSRSLFVKDPLEELLKAIW